MLPNNLTIVIPSHNNPDYLTLCYASIRKAHPTIPLIIMNDGGCPVTQQFLDGLDDANLRHTTYDERVGHTILYDVGFQMATTEYIGILHADMVVPANFFDNLLPRLQRGYVVSARCVEPPLHPPGEEKIIQNFGMTPDEFQQPAFDDYCKGHIIRTRPSLFAPWFIHRQDYFDKIGGHDITFSPYGWEDADLFVRMMNADFIPAQYSDILVYHFTQRGHRWKDGVVGVEHDGYRLQMHMMQNLFAEKWGTLNWKDEHHTPRKLHRYYKQLVAKNFTHPNREHYEGIGVFFNEVVADGGQLIKPPRSQRDSPDYTLTIDYSQHYDVGELYSFIQQLPDLVAESEQGTYEVGGMTLEIM
jgi:glycosyltransferase involved in cell wall biosynthesis